MSVCIGVDPLIETGKNGDRLCLAAEQFTAAGWCEKLVAAGEADVGTAGEQPRKE